jgi:hypothetical protein
MVSSDTPPATPTGSQSTQAYQPPKPLFGDLTQVSDTSFEPWIGGIPRVDYSDLKTKPALIEPTMYRSTYIGSAIKAEVYRNQGLKPVYDKGGDLQALQKNLMKHFRAHGLDTITYVKNTSASSTTPTGTKENPDVLCVVEHHTRFTVESVQAFMDTVKDKLDSYALKATKDAKDILYRSITFSRPTCWLTLADPALLDVLFISSSATSPARTVTQFDASLRPTTAGWR